MVGTQSLLRGLSALGLTEYEAKVYAALLAQSPATGYQVGKRAGVPRSMVYEALGRLGTRGMVLKAGGTRATLYRPMPPELLIERFQSEQRALLDGLRDEMVSLYQAPPEDTLWSISGLEAVLAYARHVVQETADELQILLNDSDLELLRPSIESAAGRGVSVQAVLTGNAELLCGASVRHPPVESQLQELTHTLILVGDGKQALVGCSREPAYATVTQNPSWVSIARQFLWMEQFTQRLCAQLGPELLSHLDARDRVILASYAPQPANLEGNR
jgi:Cd2+/Zn2+-exporting ATPase